jgi:serine-type D-Ala-D-Ala carboxypeptidase/endopeptidase (penicillin-binding protein 4)
MKSKILLAGLLLALSSTAYTQIPQVVQRELNKSGIAVNQVALIAQPLDGQAPVASHQPTRPMNPASVMKLVTSYGALQLLKPEYRWQTSAFLQGPLQGDVLEGNLVIKGGGDPKLVIEDMMEWLASWRRAGLREIRGDLIIDESLYDDIGPSMESFDADSGQPYNVRPHPVMMNFKAARIIVTPQADGSLSISTDPPLADISVNNRLTTIKGGCSASAVGMSVSDLGAKTIDLSGRYSSACGETSSFAAVLDHRQYIFSFFKAAWQANGGSITGQLRSGKATGREWSVWRSPRTLADVIRDINKFSNNVMTRQVLLQMGYEASRSPGTTQRGRQALREILLAKGLDLPDLVVENGSGLSRIERVSVQSLARLLIDASRSSDADIFRDSMPIVGVDGTMKRRLVNTAVVGNAWIKTGSINAVSSIAGYVTAQSGAKFAVALIVNGPSATGAQAAQDQFIKWVYENH